MCTVSMIGDHYSEKIQRQWPQFTPDSSPFAQQQGFLYNPVRRDEFEALKAEVAEMVALLRRAKIYDEKNGEPECEVEEKMALLRHVAKLIGVDLDVAMCSGSGAATPGQ